MDDYKLPRRIQRAIDDVLAVINSGEQSNYDASLRVLERWCEKRLDALELPGLDEGFEGLDPETYPFDFSDDALLDAEALDEAALIDDARRVSFVREQLRSVLHEGNGDSDYMPHFHTVQIRSTSGQTAVLGCGITGYSFTQVETTWYGVYASADEFLDRLRGEGWITSLDDLDGLESEELIALWTS